MRRSGAGDERRSGDSHWGGEEGGVRRGSRGRIGIKCLKDLIWEERVLPLEGHPRLGHSCSLAHQGPGQRLVDHRLFLGALTESWAPPAWAPQGHHKVPEWQGPPSPRGGNSQPGPGGILWSASLL